MTYLDQIWCRSRIPLLLIYAILRASGSKRIFRTSLVTTVQNSPEFLFGMGILLMASVSFFFKRSVLTDVLAEVAEATNRSTVHRKR